MILLTGATGIIGSRLLPELLGEGHDVRCLVRDPKALGANRVRVQLSLADLADPRGLRHAVRGAETVVHMAATIRDQPKATIEEINALGTYRLLRAAERAGVKRFIYFSAIGASRHQRTRFFRSKALAEELVEASGLETTIIAPSIVYDRDDRFVTTMRRLALLPMLPLAGPGRSTYEPIWARDAARATAATLAAEPGRYELAGPERMTHAQIVRLIAEAAGRRRSLVHVPLPIVKSGLVWLRRLTGAGAFATWEEAELMEVPMVAARGDADARALGVEPATMREVLQG